ncbi:MAG TPA: hypothetical protein DCM14_00810 [Clostridiales bacterium UBA8153]|nr:hypothetical protein [Clostridiales bacterium UBA8153]
MGLTARRDRLPLSTYNHLPRRLSGRYHPKGLTVPKIRECLCHHLPVAARTAPVFAPKAVGESFPYARGLPRPIHRICSSSLLAASLEAKELRDRCLVLLVLADGNGGGLPQG